MYRLCKETSPIPQGVAEMLKMKKADLPINHSVAATTKMTKNMANQPTPILILSHWLLNLNMFFVKIKI